MTTTNLEIIEEKDKLIKELTEELEKKNRAFQTQAEELETTKTELQSQMERNRQSEEELRKKNFMLESLIELNPYSIIIYDHDGYPVRENKAHAELFKVPQPRDLSVFDLKGFVNEGNREVLKKWRNGETVTVPKAWFSLHDFYPEWSDDPLCLTANQFSLKNEDGEIENYVVMHEDITARVFAEEELKKAHDELKILNAELEQKVEERTQELEEANEELECKNRELEDFAFRVSHKLKNSLLILKRILEMKTRNIEDVHRNISMFIEESDNLMEFVENLLQLARAGRVINNKEEFDLNTLIKGSFSLHKPDDVETELVMKGSLPMIKGDMRSLDQVFVNFFLNSFEHKDPEKEKLQIEIDCREEDGNVIIFYRDNGEGIKPENLGKVFEVSYSSKGREKYGFGMTINKNIIEAHGGSVSVKSEGENKGVEFVITLPVK